MISPARRWTCLIIVAHLESDASCASAHHLMRHMHHLVCSLQANLL
jgi:hypothetical protein